jgi:NhaP-type Na+/H+ or K+/H+ antiporter
VLFLTAMGQRAPQAWASRALLILAGVAGVVAVVIMLTFPVKV